MTDAEIQARLARLRTLEAEAEQLQAENARLRAHLTEADARIATLVRALFGAKAERLTPEQEAQVAAVRADLEAGAARPAPASDDVLADEDGPQRPRPRRPARHPLPGHLETETVTLEPESTTCPCCGQPLQRIGEEVTEELDLIPTRLIRRRIVRPKYACRCGDAGVTVAPAPARLIPQSRLGLGLAVQLLLGRYDDHLSFYRLAQQLQERHGVDLPRQQMGQWADRIAEWLRPIYEAMWQALRDSGYLQIDETPVRVLDPDVKGHAARGYLWFYAVPGGDVVIEFDRRRSLAPVQARLQGFVGTIQTDAYAVYQALAAQQPGVTRIGCAAHLRRRFYGALRDHPAEAVWYIAQIRRLYTLEDQVRGESPDVRHRHRQAEAPAIWAAMKAQAEAQGATVLPQSALGQALTYFLGEYDALVGYLADGRFEPDTNLVENAIRPTVVGRKRWLFIGHPDAGWRSAVLYSILISCRRRGINPANYLTDVLRRLPTLKITQIKTVLPGNWQPATG
jgi:transposase